MNAPLLVELLTEELPARGLRALGALFGSGIHDSLAKMSLTPSRTDTNAKTFATPRRLAVLIDDVAALQPEQHVERKGPTVMAGLKDGHPTQALLGFAKSCGVPVAELARAGDGKAEHFVFHSIRLGEPLATILPSVVAAVIKSLPAPKLMRWGASDITFIRPLQGLVMIHGSALIAGTVLELQSGTSTRGHRFLGEPSLDFTTAADYEAVLEARAKVMPDFAKRARQITAALTKMAGNATLADASLVEEVAALVEWPAVYEAQFDPAFLEVPQECLMLTMKANQKYFPLLDAQGTLLNRFLLVSNMDIPDPRHIIAGNERVIRARLSDAKFFFDQDRKKKLSDWVASLQSVVFHNKLGTQLARSHRIQSLAEKIASLIGAEPSAARHAGHLCKADLMSGMVGEFPELQGLMGMYYARHGGESEVVARAIDHHYRPRFAGDILPESSVGDCVAIADKLDTLVGIYGVGFVPTGDKDPFGLRRAALGVLRILVEHGLKVDARQLFSIAAEGFEGITLSATVVDDLVGFMLDRLRSYLRDRDYTVDEIEAVLASTPTRLDLVIPRLEAVKLFRRLPESSSLAAANKRIANILRKSAAAATTTFDHQLLAQDEERALYASLHAIEPQVDAQMKAGQFAEALRSLAGLRTSVDAFFDKVMVNAEDATIRANRLALLGRLERAMNQVADISKLAV